jgi:branched-subunit amino acid ABC-type transport system permease component
VRRLRRPVATPVALLIILVVLLVKPTGLFGKPITRRV